MFLLKLTVCLLLIIAFADAQLISCRTTCVANVTAEGDNVTAICHLEYFGTPTLTWHNKLNGEEIQRIPLQKQQGNITSRDYTGIALAPAVVPQVCSARIPNVRDAKTCETRHCDILYSVRNVLTWPLLFASPGEEITCKANGNPEPSFEWQQKENDGDGEWEDVPGETSEKIEAPPNNGTYQLRCVAKNTVKRKEYSANSLPVIVSKDGAAIRTKIIIGVVVSVVILAIIGGLVYFFVLKD